MSKKPKKQIHRPTFLYLDKGNITPKDYQAPSEDLEVKKKQQEAPPKKGRNFEVYNDIIVSLLDRLPTINHFFGVPEVAIETLESQEVKSKKAYKESLGTYAEILAAAKTEKQIVDKKLNTLASQKYALLQLWVKAEDAHGNNILIQENSEKELIPIPINYTRCLADDFSNEKNIARTTRWEDWPALQQAPLPEIVHFVTETDPHALAKELKEAFFKLFASELSDKQKERFEIKFTHFEANLIMVQEAIKAGLTFREIIALILPHIDKYAFNFITGGVLEGGELWPARKRFLKLDTGFLIAWSRAKKWDGFSMNTFKTAIVEQIQQIKKLPPATLYDNYYTEICFELRRALFL